MAIGFAAKDGTGETRGVSDSDSFIQEVSEEVRRDRMFRLWRRYAPLVLAAIVAVVGAAAVSAWLDHRRETAARDVGDTLLDAGEAGDPRRRAEAFLAAADAMNGGAAMLARLRAAGELAASGDAAGAARLYRAVAEAADTEPAFAAFAAYRAAVLAAPEAGPRATVAALTPLTAPEGPFRLLALEARAAAHLALGEHDAARADIALLAIDPTVTENTRARAQELLTILGAAASDG